MYQSYCYLLDTHSKFKNNHYKIPFIKKPMYFLIFNELFYNPFYSLHNQHFKLTKFTKGWRNVYKYKFF